MIYIKTLLISTIILINYSCDKSTGTMAATMQKKHEPISFLALGDSYTIGERVAVTDRWPVQLVDSLNKRGYHFSEPEIIARTGWTTDELINGLRNNPPDSAEYDLVSLLIGVNNQYRGRSLDQYRIDFKELLDTAIEFAANKPDRVIVLSIPDWGVTPFAASRDTQKIAAEIDAFNQVNHEESLAVGVRYFDITPISRQAKNNPELIAQDGLHPSGKMYAEWVKILLPTMTELFKISGESSQ